MSNIRTFIAVDVSPEVQIMARRLIQKLTQAGVDYRWVAPENMHLTLKFLGNIQDREVPDVCRAVTSAVANLPPISVTVRGLGAFPSRARPRILWMGIEHGHDELIALQQAVEAALHPLGFLRERQDYRPHLTLGRQPAGQRDVVPWTELMESEANTIFGGFEVDAVVVYASYLERNGPVYTPMATIELDG